MKKVTWMPCIYFLEKNDLTLIHQAGAEFEYAESFNNRRYFSKFTVSKAWTPFLSQFVAHNIETNHTTKLPGGITEKAIEDFGRKEEVNYLNTARPLGGVPSMILRSTRLDVLSITVISPLPSSPM